MVWLLCLLLAFALRGLLWLVALGLLAALRRLALGEVVAAGLGGFPALAVAVLQSLVAELDV